MKKFICITLICLGFIFILNGCSGSENENENKSITTISQSSNTNGSEQSPPVTEKSNVTLNKNKVIGKVKLVEGIYFDDRRFGENTLKSYGEVKISNITETSFDFTVYDVTVSDGEKNKKVMILTSTAVFVDNGMRAVYKGKNYTLEFTFPNNHNAEPIVTDIKISGYKLLEGKTFVNNSIPGHEFG